MAAASLGTATGSRVDSAAKHTMACKLDTKFFKISMVKEAALADNLLHQNKMKYAMQKDEIVMNTTKKQLNPTGSQAYPLVITTLGDLTQCDEAVKFLKELYACVSVSSFLNMASESNIKQIVQTTNEDKRAALQTILHNLPDFRCQGVALGQGYASHLSGDTVATVLVGGMASVMNGHFEMQPGDEVQWYFDFEQDQFWGKDNHRVLNEQNQNKPALHDVKRQKYNEARLMGSQPGMGNVSGIKSNSTIFRIKPYRPCNLKTEGDNPKPVFVPHYGDKSRVFAKCITGGRAFDMVDIMIMTQSS